MRARRVWWERNGTFVRGVCVGLFVTLLSVWVLSAAGFISFHARG